MKCPRFSTDHFLGVLMLHKTMIHNTFFSLLGGPFEDINADNEAYYIKRNRLFALYSLKSVVGGFLS